MTLEERVSALEGQLTSMETEYREAIRLANFLGGSGRVFQAATLTLVAAYPHKTEFRALFLQICERLIASSLGSSVDEDHLDAIEAARTLVLQHLEMQ